jgi:hypothetical protein
MIIHVELSMGHQEIYVSLEELLFQDALELFVTFEKLTGASRKISVGELVVVLGASCWSWEIFF